MSHSPQRLMPNLDIRVATADDIPEILRQRRAMYEDIDCHDADLLAAMVSVSAGFLAKALADSGHGWPRTAPAS